MNQLRKIKVALGGSSGFTLIEVLLAVSITSLAVGLVGARIFQVTNVRRFWADDALATKNLRHAGSWFAGDALNAEKALTAPGGNSLSEDCATPPASPVSTVTLTWTDTDNIARQRTYSAAAGALTRTNEAGDQTAIIISGVVDNSVKISLCKSLLTLELKVEADRQGTETMTLSSYLRKLTP